MSPKSIRTRLTFWYTAVLAVGLTLLSCTVWLALRYSLYADLGATLVNQARGLEEYVHIEDRGSASHLSHEIDEFSRSLPQDHLLLVTDGNGQLLYENRSGEQGVALSLSRFRLEGAPRKINVGGHHYLAVARDFTLAKRTVHVALVLSSTALEHPIGLLRVLLMIAVPAFIILGAAGGYLLSRRALLPVDEITERARTISLQNLSERLLVPDTDDEIQRLAETWNDMLRRLEIAVSKISQFTADASHELRTPIAIIRLTAENAIRKTRTEGDYRAALHRIQNESENMTRLIEDLLFLARAGVDQSPGELDPVDLRVLIESTCLDLSPLASAKSIRLTTEVWAGSVSVRGNASALRRVLLILLDNAIKYTPKGGFVSVRLERKSDDALLIVEDNGIGIPREAEVRVFERFFRVDPSRNKESGGHGLGLAIAHAIVTQHTGSIALRTKAAGGCIFSVSLPLSPCPGVAGDAPVDNPHSAAAH